MNAYFNNNAIYLTHTKQYTKNVLNIKIKFFEFFKINKLLSLSMIFK